jgi:transposase
MTKSEKQRLLDEIAKRDEIIARQAAEILILRQNIDALSRKIFGASSEKLDPGQGLFDFASSETASPASATIPIVPIKPPNNRKKSSKTRAPRIPEHLPIEREEVIPPQVQLDPTAFRRIGEEVSEQLHFKRAEFFRKQVVCGKYVLIDNPIAPPVIAPLPPSLQERSIASPSLISEVIYNRFVLHLPYYRQVEMFNSMGVNFHRKTLCDWALLGSDWLDIIYRNIQQEHWRSPYRQLDETPIRYLEPGTGKAQTGYLWTSNIPGGSVFFHWHEGRDATGIDALFADDPENLADLSDEEIEKLTAVIQCDGYQVYRSRAEKRRWLKLIGCQAHMRRKFFEAQDQAPKLIAWILHQIALLYQIEERLREQKAGPALREAVRAAESQIIHRRLKKAIDKLALRSSILPRTKLGKAITYAINQWQYLEGYLTDGRVKSDTRCGRATRIPTPSVPPNLGKKIGCL